MRICMSRVSFLNLGLLKGALGGAYHDIFVSHSFVCLSRHLSRISVEPFAGTSRCTQVLPLAAFRPYLCDGYFYAYADVYVYEYVYAQLYLDVDVQVYVYVHVHLHVHVHVHVHVDEHAHVHVHVHIYVHVHVHIYVLVLVHVQR